MAQTSPATRSHSNGSTGLPMRARIADDDLGASFAYWWSKLSGRSPGAILTCAGCAQRHELDTIVCVYLAAREAVLAPLCPSCDGLLATGQGERIAARLEHLRPQWRPHALPVADGGGVVNVLDLGARR